ncbi:DNA methyltransferase [Salinigranum sp. GCM10025319]|uniref:DNA methyltransferase n=1 Tax=Salinigranum sp. GCM10025319 TaxID=3252687 RepID=UPI0036119DEB
MTDGEAGSDASDASDESKTDADGRDDDLKPHQRRIDDRGIYDERNRVNDLTGREWKYATKSVIAESYPPDFQHGLRSEHGGQKPPRLCMDLIERFSKAGERVLDPFAGVGGTLFGASLAEYESTGYREAIGFERVGRWVDLYHEVRERENRERRDRGQGTLASQELRHGDCADLIDDLAADSVDLLLTDVPYWSMDAVEQTRNPDRTRESKLGRFDAPDTPDAAGGADDPDDVGGVADPASKAEWLSEMAATFDSFRRVLRDGAYVLVFIGDMYRDSSFHFLSADLARELEATGLTLKADLIWYDPAKDLHVYGYPFAFVPSMVHQHVLVLREE